jgi:hypothetical protein
MVVAPNPEIPRDLVSRVTGGGPLSFRHNGGMTEVRLVPLAFAGLAALQRLDSGFQGHDFAGQQILAHEVFMRLTTGGLVKIHYRHRDFGPAQGPASFKPPLPDDPIP